MTLSLCAIVVRFGNGWVCGESVVGDSAKMVNIGGYVSSCGRCC